LGIDPRTSRRYVSGELAVPKATAMLLELMLKTKLAPDRAAKLI
jgi:hypothetical protein